MHPSGEYHFLVTPRLFLIVVLGAAPALAQEPTRPDSAKKTATLPVVTSTAPREERVQFEQKPNVGTIRITGEELTSAPRFFGEADILRAVRLLPGVNARNDYSVGMNVRGGEADQNLVLLDGYPIYNPFHMGGLFGAFVEPMVDRVDFLTGGFPARYGGRLSSVLDVRSKEERRAGVHGRTDVSMLATTVALGGGLQSGRGSWNVAARRTYADKVADVFYKKGALPYHFRDVQAHFTGDLPRGWELSFTAYDNVDDLLHESDATGPDDGTYVIGWGNRIFGTTLSRTFENRWGDSTRLEQRLSTSRFNVGMEIFEGALALDNTVRDSRLSGVLTTFRMRHESSIGYDVGAQRYRFGANYPLLLYPADSVGDDNTTLAAFVEDVWRPDDRWIIQGGVRVDRVSSADGAASTLVQPRLSVKRFVSRDLALTAAVGLFGQPVHSLAREDVPIRALDFWVGSGSAAPISRAAHYVVGIERWLSRSRAARVETFYKRYSDLVEQNPYSDPNVTGDEFLPLHGASYGGDIMLRQFGERGFNGWLSYSFALNSRVDAFGRSFRPGQDRRHEMNLVTNWVGRRYTWAARLNVATGTPYTRVVAEAPRYIYDPFYADLRETDFGQFLTGDRNAERLPTAQRLDLSVTRNPRPGRLTVSPFLSVMNVYNARNVFAYLFDYSALPPEKVGLRQFPLFPTIGVSLVW